MIQIDTFWVDEALLEEAFVCDLTACRGACCVEGTGGAPLTWEETEVLARLHPQVAPALTPEGQAELLRQGTHVVDPADGLPETPLVGPAGPCAYAVYENGIALCGIERLWAQGQIDFRKPISCHLYPIRVLVRGGFTHLYYHRWQVCSPACANGSRLQVPVYVFLKEAIVRAFGADFYDQLTAVAQAHTPRA